jgi:hypothetical protein
MKNVPASNTGKGHISLAYSIGIVYEFRMYPKIKEVVRSIYHEEL